MAMDASPTPVSKVVILSFCWDHQHFWPRLRRVIQQILNCWYFGAPSPWPPPLPDSMIAQFAQKSKDKLLALKTRALGLSSMLQLASTLDQSLANSLLVVAALCSSVFAVLKAQRLADEDGSASIRLTGVLQECALKQAKTYCNSAFEEGLRLALLLRLLPFSSVGWVDSMLSLVPWMFDGLSWMQHHSLRFPRNVRMNIVYTGTPFKHLQL